MLFSCLTASSVVVAPVPRRAALAIGAAAASLRPQAACAAVEAATGASPASAMTLGTILESTSALPETTRAPASLVLRPEYGIESADVLYPEWALGRWAARSTLRSVLAPAGDELFSPGRNGTEALRRARLEAGTALEYPVKWIQPGGRVVVDREYNVASISRATMGPEAVQDARADGPDHLTMVLRPAGAPSGSLFSADLRVVGRRTDPYPLAERPNFFACAETTRQTVTTVAGERAAPGPPRAPLIKEIETICTYELDSRDSRVMRGQQRTASFLVPDAGYTGDPSLAELAASRLARAPNGRIMAVDVRVYDVTYTRL